MPESRSTSLEHRSFDDGRIYLFRRTDYKRPTWFCRLKIEGVKGYIYRSTKTADERRAFAFAQALYRQFVAKSLSGVCPRAKPISFAISAYIERFSGDQERLSVRYRVLLAKRLLPHVGGYTFDQLSAAVIVGWTSRLAETSRGAKLSPNTVKRIHADLKHILRWAEESGHVVPQFKWPKVGTLASRRPHFDHADWQRLLSYLPSFVSVDSKATRRDRIVLANYVLILANSGLRAGEARKLRWRDIREIAGLIEGHTSIVLHVSGKTGKRDVVAGTSDVKIWLRALRDLRQAELAREGMPVAPIPADEFVFCRPNGSSVESFKRSFGSLVRGAGVEKDTHGAVRTVYSLRHTYATFRLESGVDIYQLARNMGTSVSMIEQFYGHTSNVAAAHELTKIGCIANAKPLDVWLDLSDDASLLGFNLAREAQASQT